MKIIHVFEEIPTILGPSIMLLGPSSLDEKVTAWRQEAIQYLQATGFDGTILVPEPRSRGSHVDYPLHLEWVLQACQQADVLLFWIPRHLVHMPALKTNVEVGMFIRSNKFMLGAPPDAQKMHYIRTLAAHYGHCCYETLPELLQAVQVRLQALWQQSSVRGIRQLRHDDVPQLAALYSQQEKGQVSASDLQQASRVLFQSEEKGDRLIGYFRQGELIGCLSMHYMIQALPGQPAERKVHLSSVIVGGDYQFQGIGTELVQHALQLAEQAGATGVQVQAAAGNHAVQRVLDKNGFMMEDLNFHFRFAKATWPAKKPEVQLV